ncbi:cytohesin-3-like [Styela clava]
MKMTAESALLDLPIQDQEILKAIWRKKGILLEEIEKLKRELKDVNKEIEQVEDSEESKSNSRAKQLAIGKKRFNSDPKKINSSIDFISRQSAELLMHI